ncbi:hypothetical protein JHK87_000350 [Glycine soja]|nr:hypothetical protein JHK87_000350 [Glycine soja]
MFTQTWIVGSVLDKRLVGLHEGGGLYFWERAPIEYEASGYKLCLGMEENSESALSTNKEAISNATRNLMESSILAQDERWRHALHMQVGREVVFPVADGDAFALSCGGLVTEVQQVFSRILPINYRRHICIQHRLKKLDKDSDKNRDLLGAYWDKLSVEEAKEVVSFKNVMLEVISLLLLM